jgi:hypothetical protein
LLETRAAPVFAAVFAVDVIFSEDTDAERAEAEPPLPPTMRTLVAAFAVPAHSANTMKLESIFFGMAVFLVIIF